MTEQFYPDPMVLYLALKDREDKKQYLADGGDPKVAEQLYGEDKTMDAIIASYGRFP